MSDQLSFELEIPVTYADDLARRVYEAQGPRNPNGGYVSPWKELHESVKDFARRKAMPVASIVMADVIAEMEREFEPRLAEWFRDWAAERGIRIGEPS